LAKSQATTLTTAVKNSCFPAKAWRATLTKVRQPFTSVRWSSRFSVSH
jgi:hypothetical protein